MTEPETQGLAALADLRVVELGVRVAAPATSALDLPLRPAPAAPTLGEHNDEVFAELATRSRPAGSVSSEPGPGPAAPGR